jgi:hypothetical protein
LRQISAPVVDVAGSYSVAFGYGVRVDVRAFPVRLPSGQRYWTVLDEDLAVVAEVDAFLRQVRLGSYSGGGKRPGCGSLASVV